MRLILFYLSFCLISLPLGAQYLHTPEEMLRIMDKSQLRYIIDTLPEKKSNVALPVLKSGWLAKRTPEGVKLVQSVGISDKKVANFHEKARLAYERQQYEKALSWSKKAHQLAPSNTEIMKRIGRSYTALGQYDTAAYWYKQALEVNFVDFEAHYLLATNASRQEDYELALQHITLAHVLNRNQKDILSDLKEIYTKAGQGYKMWQFSPDYQFFKRNEKEIQITSGEKPWLAYASCKAIWAFEPGYREKMKILSSASNRITEEKECLLNALITFEKMEGDKSEFPALQALSVALPERMVDYYILYEVLAPQQPLEISKLTPQQLEKLVRYVRHYRAATL